jgi:transcriptional regulator with XRE-family HTH domain
MPRKDASGARNRKPRAGRTPDTASALPKVIGANLKALRTRQGYSLERLAKAAGVSRAMLSQIEHGQSVPTILLLLKVANSLKVPVAILVADPSSRRPTVLKPDNPKLLSLSAGRYRARLLFPAEPSVNVEFYEVSIAAGHTELLDAQPAGTKENFIVVKGHVELTVGREPPIALSQGEAAFLPSTDLTRQLRNPDGSEAVLHFVVNLSNAGRE